MAGSLGGQCSSGTCLTDSQHVHLDGVMGVVGALEPLDADSHLSLADDGRGSVVVDGVAHGRVELVDVFPVDGERLEALALKGLGDVVALEVLGRVPAGCVSPEDSMQEEGDRLTRW